MNPLSLTQGEACAGELPLCHFQDAADGLFAELERYEAFVGAFVWQSLRAECGFDERGGPQRVATVEIGRQ